MAAGGILSFARFMELALYCPVYGFYEKEKDTVGRAGDFYTSVSVGSLYGELLAFQLAEWLEAEVRSQKSEVRIVEAGAHDGKLAQDILKCLREHRPELFAQIQYLIIEPSARRQQWQRETLKDFAPHIRWFADFENLKLKTQNSKLNAVFFSNELLDAMPVQRFGWDAKIKTWFEWGVALEGDKFVWVRIPETHHASSELNSPSAICHLPSAPELLAVLPDGYIIETSPAAENWWRQAAGALHRGKLVTIDYGFTAAELCSPARTNGTLRSYRAHHYAENVLANPGEQDITAHVNFAAIQSVGESAGLKTDALVSQPQFPTRIVRQFEGELAATRHGEAGWTPVRTRQFQTLTHPEHLGRAFRVLVQSR